MSDCPKFLFEVAQKLVFTFCVCGEKIMYGIHSAYPCRCPVGMRQESVSEACAYADSQEQRTDVP